MGGASLPVNGVGPGMDKIKNMENKKGVPPPLSRPQSNGPPSRPDQVKTKSTKSDHLHLHGSIRIPSYLSDHIPKKKHLLLTVMTNL